MGDLVGWLIALLSLSLAFADKTIYRNPRVFWVFLASVMAHNLASMYSYYVATLTAGASDAEWFHEGAVDNSAYGNQSIGTAGLYMAYLRFIYRIFGTSIFLGSQMSVLMFSLSLLFFVKAVNCRGHKAYMVPLIALYGLMPGPIAWTSVTLREAYQSGFFIIAVSIALIIRRSRNYLLFPFLLAAVFGLACSHQGLMFYGIIAFPLLAFWSVGTGPLLLQAVTRTIGLGVGLLVGLTIFSTMQNLPGLMQTLTTSDFQTLAEYAEGYGGTTLEARTTYPIRLDVSSPHMMVATSILTFIQYEFSVYPWQIGNALDLYACLEGILRVALVVCGLWYARKSKQPQRSETYFLFLMALPMEFLFNAGTRNWGTALRHHVVPWGLVVLAGGPYLLYAIGWGKKKVKKAVAPRRRQVPAAG